VPSRALSFTFQSLQRCSKAIRYCLCLLHRLPFPFIFPSVTLFRRQFLRKLEPIQIASICFTYVEYFFPPWLHVIPFQPLHDRSKSSSQYFSRTTLPVVLIDFPSFPSYSSTHSYAPNAAFYQFHPKISVQCACEKALFLLNAVYVMAILNCIVRVYIAQFCFHVTEVVEIFYILLLLLICLNLHWGWLSWDSHYFSSFHSILQSDNLKYKVVQIWPGLICV